MSMGSDLGGLALAQQAASEAEKAALQAARQRSIDQTALGGRIGDDLRAQTDAVRRGDSAGNALLRQGTDAALANQASTSASARGGAMSLAGARNQAATNAVTVQGQAANQAATLKSQEMAQALGAQSQYQLGREGNINAALGSEITKTANDQQAALARAKLNAEASARNQQIIGSAVGAGAGLMMLSDERAKEDIAVAPPSALEALMDAQNPTTYKYRGDDQQRLGVIAQDLEETELGRLLVQQGADGYKRIDKDAALSAMLAEIGALHERLNELGAKNATVGKGGR